MIMQSQQRNTDGSKTMTETRTIKWTTLSGTDIAITMVAQYDLDLQGRRKDSGRLEIDITTTIDGESIGRMARLETIDHPQLVAKIGRVGLTQEHLDRYNADLADLEASIAPHNADYDAYESTLDAVSDSTQRLERQMSYGDN